MMSYRAAWDTMVDAVKKKLAGEASTQLMGLPWLILLRCWN